MANDVTEAVRRLADGVFPGLVALRRHLHQYPEPGWTEFRTAALVAERLQRLGWEVRAGRDVVDDGERMGLPEEDVLEEAWRRAGEAGADPAWLAALRGGFTGVVATLRGGPGPTVGIRFDMDALEITESDALAHRPAREGFCSRIPGAMHACGHDAHVAAGLGVAEVLAALRHELRGTVVLVFQPAEEGVRGARAMVAAGVVDDVDYMLCHHVQAGHAVGELVPANDGYAATDKMDALFTGRPAHAGASPHLGRNALLAACTAVLGLYAIARHGEGATRVNVGRLQAGSARNAIPAEARIALETRGATNELSDYMREEALRVLRGAAAMQGCDLEVRPMGSARSANADAALVERVRDVALRLGPRSFLPALPTGGSEDYTYMMRRVQERGGLATNIGVGAALRGVPEPLRGHTPTFDIDERAIQVAVELLSLLALDLTARPITRTTTP